jgi:hypothetical protein
MASDDRRLPAVSACRLASYLEIFRVIDARQAEENPPALNSIKSGSAIQVELTPALIAHLRVQYLAAAAKPRQIVSEISYAGDEGGIVCHIVPEDGRNAIIVSLTHVRMHNSPPFATAVFDYQKHRVKKLKKQNKT